MASTACPFCFHRIDSSRLAYQCVGRGNVECKKAQDEARLTFTGSTLETFPTFTSPGRAVPANCPSCGGPGLRRACPVCHTALPIDFVDTKSPLIGLVGAKGSGKTVLMTVLVKQLRAVVGRRFSADIHIATDNPDGYQGLTEYQANREQSLFNSGTLPPATAQQQQFRRTPVVLRWRQESGRRLGGQALRSTVLSFVDTAGEDLNDLGTAFTLQYLSVCNALMVTLDPFTLPGARARLNLPPAAIEAGEGAALSVVTRITELLRTEHGVKNNKKIKLPVALVFTKIDAFYPLLDRQNPIMALPPEVPAYQDSDGQAMHENMLALMHSWQAADIDTHMRLNYSDFRYFGVSALGAEPDYATRTVAPGGVQPHRVEDPLLWLLSKTRTVPSA